MFRRNKNTSSPRTLLILFAVLVVGFFTVQWWQRQLPEVDIVLADQPLTIEVAQTAVQRYRGLSGRPAIGSDGLLFLFRTDDRHAIVMRDMQFPIDIVWLVDGEVVDIAPAVAPEPDTSELDLTRYYPRTDADMVLELPAGWAARNGLQIGNRLEIVQE